MSTYLFIDGGYLRSRFTDFTKRFYGIECMPDLAGIGDSMGGKHTTRSFDKAFYYDCFAAQLADQASGATGSLSRNEDKEFVNTIRAMPRWHVQEGRLVGGRKDGRGQKRVDVLLTVEMLSHAFAKNMTRAVLIAGDDDFTPLVSELIRHGIYVELWSDPRSTAKHLADSADEHHPMKTWFHWRLMSSSLRDTRPFPEFTSSHLVNLQQLKIQKRGLTRYDQVVVVGTSEGLFHYATMENFGARSHARDFDQRVLEELLKDEFRNTPLELQKWEAE